ncbi:MAG TPA: LytR C-terminal domain-containing protein [Pseudonocardiaceae bacterium]|nr:LytR C-terminal domain-containing protein [Pseudonocardiaceae bacterium]
MRPTRLVGFVLVGVAVVAVGLGVFTLTSNGASPQGQGRPPVTSGTTPPPATTTTPKPTRTTTTKPRPTTTQQPSGQTTTVAPPPPANTTTPSLKQTVGVRVYNNSFIKDLAAKAADAFTSDGFNVVQVGNYSQGNIPTSTVYFSPAPGEQQVATELGKDFGMRVLPRFPGIAFASPGVIVIVTMDFKGGGS